mgnify:FL=1|tara:strand:+ start:1912 stop:2607 length:696 start_codon:yes stop_codon:yes gene_type:complete
MSVLPKINEEKLAEAEMMEKVSNEVLDPQPIEQPVEEILPEIQEPDNKSQEQMFEKAEPEVEISKKTGKPKRKLNQAQLDGLKKAREKSKLRRQQMKEAKDIEKQTKKMAREAKIEEKMQKQEESEAIVRMKAEMKASAEKSATWDEEKLSSLMMKTIDTYMEKKKAMKAKPQVSIPKQQTPHRPIDPMFYNGYGQPNQYTTQPQYAPVPRLRRKPATPINTLFGNFMKND